MTLPLDPEVVKHIERLKDAAFNRYNLGDIPRYLTENTYLNGERYSFKDHEYQFDLLSDTSRVVYAQKCAQVGITEAQMRYGLALARIIPYFSVIMTWPFSGDASNMVKTRMEPIIQGSPDLLDSIDPDLDNVEVKGLGTSLMYMRGTSGTTSAISVAADALIHDEIDRSDAFTIAQYQSRIKHSRYKLVRAFGTPTREGHGIALLMETSRRKRHMCRCEHCNHQFVPSYHTDVKIPGFDGDKKEITKYNLTSFRWQEAVLLCPRCGRAPSLQPVYREWVIENASDTHEAVGYFISPFSAPNIVSTSSLVRESTVYGSWTEFCNQALGETNQDDDMQLTKADVNACKVLIPLDSTNLHHMGIDVGQICHIVVGRLTLSGELLVVHREQCVLSALVERKRALAIQYRCLMTVIDNFPETALVLQMQNQDSNLYGGVYHRNSRAPTYQLKMVEKDLAEGKLPTNQASILRNLNFDEVMALFKGKRILWAAKGDRSDDLFVDHCTDMTRQQEVDTASRGLIWVWNKSKEGNDHFMHALGYLHVACRLAPAASNNLATAIPVRLIGRIRCADKGETSRFGRKIR